MIMLGLVFDCQSQREKVPGAGACGQGVSNRTGAGWGGVNCASALCGVTVSAETEAGSFVWTLNGLPLLRFARLLVLSL